MFLFKPRYIRYCTLQMKQIFLQFKTLITPAVVSKMHTLFEMIFWNNYAWLNNWICAEQCWMLHALRGDGFDCLLTLISIKMQHPRPLQVCTNICILYAHTGAGVIRSGISRQLALAILRLTYSSVFYTRISNHFPWM